MAYWLIKSEPSAYSISDLANEPNQITYWDGVRNYQARNMMRDQMQIGDQVLFYHSNCKPPGIVGIVEVARGAYPDHTALDPSSEAYDPKSSESNPRWYMVDLKLVESWSGQVALPQLKSASALSDMPLVKRGNRLSMMPVTHDQWAAIFEMANKAGIR